MIETPKVAVSKEEFSLTFKPKGGTSMQQLNAQGLNFIGDFHKISRLGQAATTVVNLFEDGIVSGSEFARICSRITKLVAKEIFK